MYYDFLITGEWNNTVWGPPHTTMYTVWGPPHTTMYTVWGPPHTTMYWRPHQELLLLEAFAEVAGGGGLEGGAVHPPGVAVGGAGVEGPQEGVRRVRALRHLHPRVLRQLLQLLEGGPAEAGAAEVGHPAGPESSRATRHLGQQDAPEEVSGQLEGEQGGGGEVQQHHHLHVVRQHGELHQGGVRLLPLHPQELLVLNSP